ncbi:TOM1-like protein 2 [Cichlidogyrus casuarinus]|uniref:TOM1-like protein 2 n=1 Tax=Cichlidogyrus casuarinus TaxID=1844966 RepID=A0ABD2QJ90_9PLAT
MQNLFQPHPYSTQIGALIERATDSGQSSENWVLILEVCDQLNETDEGPREALRAIRKRLNSAVGKDHLSIWYTLTLIEALIKHCGKRVQAQVANKDFLKDLIRVLSPKHDPPQQIQSRILFMIKLWVDCCWDVTGRRELEKVYTALKQKGVQFPNFDSVDPNTATHLMTGVKASQDASLVNQSDAYRARIVSNHLTSQQQPVSFVDNQLKVVQVNRRQTLGCKSPAVYVQLPPCDDTSPKQSHKIVSALGEWTEKARCESILPKKNGNQMLMAQGPRNANSKTAPNPENRSQTMTIVPAQKALQSVARSQNYITFSSSVEEVPLGSGRMVLRQTAPTNPRAVSRQGVLVQEPTKVRSSPNHAQMDEYGTVRRLSRNQRVKLSQDLNVVETNLRVFVDMLSELRPDHSTNSDDLHLLYELHRTCRAMQQRVVDFLSQVADEKATGALLQVNDNLNSAFLKFDRFERYRQKCLRATLVAIEERSRRRREAEMLTGQVVENAEQEEEDASSSMQHLHQHTHFHRHNHLHQHMRASPSTSAETAAAQASPIMTGLGSPSRRIKQKLSVGGKQMIDRQKLLNEIQSKANINQQIATLDLHESPTRTRRRRILLEDNVSDEETNYQKLFHTRSTKTISPHPEMARLLQKNAAAVISKQTEKQRQHPSFQPHPIWCNSTRSPLHKPMNLAFGNKIKIEYEQVQMMYLNSWPKPTIAVIILSGSSSKNRECRV